MICTWIVALNMLVAMMNDSFRRIRVCALNSCINRRPIVKKLSRNSVMFFVWHFFSANQKNRLAQ